MKTSRLCFLSLAFLFAATSQLMAQAEKDVPSPKQSAVETKINRWIEQLTDDSSTARDTARQNLVAAGADAIGPLKSAATNGDPQTAYSSLRLLAEMLVREDPAISEKAKQAVKEIADGKSPSARQAKKVLEQAPLEKENRRNEIMNPIAGPGNQVVSISKSIINGSERVVVQENGRRIEIVRDPRRVVVTIKDADGEETVFKADNEAELKKASKKAWNLFDKYLNQQNGVQIAIGGIGGRGVFGGAGLKGLQMDPFGDNPIFLNPFSRNRRRPGQKDSLQEIARLLKEAKAVATDAKKGRDLDKLQSILDKLDHMETHLELLRRERGQ